MALWEFWITPWDKGQIKRYTGTLKLSPERRATAVYCTCSASQETAASYGTWMFITAFTTASHWSISRERWIHFKHCPMIYIIPLLILSWHLPISPLFSYIPTRTPHPLRPFLCHLSDELNIPWFDHSNNIWQVMILLILQFSFFLYSHYQVLFTPFLEHPQLCSSLRWNIFKGQKTREHRVHRKEGALITENEKIQIKIRMR